jgi:hypothetical protein
LKVYVLATISALGIVIVWNTGRVVSCSRRYVDNAASEESAVPVNVSEAKVHDRPAVPELMFTRITRGEQVPTTEDPDIDTSGIVAITGDKIKVVPEEAGDMKSFLYLTAPFKSVTGLPTTNGSESIASIELNIKVREVLKPRVTIQSNGFPALARFFPETGRVTINASHVVV